MLYFYLAVKSSNCQTNISKRKEVLMKIVKFDPFSLRFPSTFEDFDTMTTSVPLDIDETDNEVVVTASIPGINPEEVDISITRDTLTIKGKSEKKEEKKTKTSYVKEISYGEFSRVVSWPTEIQTDKVEAHFENGLLKVVAPKAEEVKPKSVKIKVKAQNK